MANTARRKDYTNKYGGMFVPMNVEGNTYNDSFLSIPKILTIFGVFVGTILLIVYVRSKGVSITGTLILFVFWVFIASLFIRFIVFQEKYYLKVYRKLKQYQVSSPSIFWDITSRKTTEDGTILTYTDGKIGCIVKLERDTITGKPEDFMERHYDAWSDFYNDIASRKFTFVQMNLMEPAGKDPRLAELDKLTYKSSNKNICSLTEEMLAHIKNIARNSLFESDYIGIYTTNLSSMNKFLDDVAESVSILMDGAYIGYEILTDRGLSDRVREEYGVGYFNATEASLTMIKEQNGPVIEPFDIYGIVWASGEEQVLKKDEVNKAYKLSSGVIRETLRQKEVSFRESVYREKEKEKFGIEFDSLSKAGVSRKKQSKVPVAKKEDIDEVIDVSSEEEIDF